MIRDVHASSRRQVKEAFRSRCWLNDVEVTDRTIHADSRRGIVRMYKRDSDGCFFLDADGRIAQEEQRGRVRLMNVSRTGGERG